MKEVNKEKTLEYSRMLCNAHQLLLKMDATSSCSPDTIHHGDADAAILGLACKITICGIHSHLMVLSELGPKGSCIVSMTNI